MSNSWDSLLGGQSNMIGAPTPELETEEEKRKKAETWLSGIGNNPLDAAGDLLNPLSYNGGKLTKVEDFAARSILSAGKKVSATMDALRLIEEEGKAGQYANLGDNFDYLSTPVTAMQSPGLFTKGILETGKELFVENPTKFMIKHSPFLDPETTSILGEFTKKTDETVNLMKAQFEAENGGMTEGMKMLGQAQSWSQVHAAFKEDKWGILRDMGTEAAGQIIALAATRKLPGGASGQITGAGAISFGFNFGINVQDSLAQGKQVNEALDDGLTKTYADVLGDTMGLGLAGIKYAKKKIYDRLWQFGADSIGSTLLMKQSREAVDEDMSFGDLVANFGSNIFFSTPAEIFSAVKEHKYDASVKDALIADAYKGNTTAAQVVVMGSFLDARAERNQNGLDLEEAVAAMQAENGLPPVSAEEINVTRTNDPKDLPAAREANTLPAAGQYNRNATGTPGSIGWVQQLSNRLGIEETHGPGGGLLKQSKRITEESFKKGKAILAWGSKETERMRAALFDHDVSSPEMQLVRAREKLEAEIETDVHTNVNAFLKELLPNVSIIVTDKIFREPTLNEDGTPNEVKTGGLLTHLEPAPDGTPRYVLSLNKSRFFKQDNSTRQADGSPSLVYDKTKMLTTLVHEFGHAFVAQKVKGFSNQAIEGLRESYNTIMAAVENIPLGEAIQVLYPKGLIPSVISALRPEVINFPLSKLKKSGPLTEFLSFREFLANQFAKAVLEDDKAMSVLPGLRPLIAEMKQRTSQIEESLGSSFPDAKKALTSAFIENLLHIRTAKEEKSMKGVEGLKDYNTPTTDNSAWFKLKQGEDFFAIDTESVVQTSDDVKVPEPERRALKRTILALAIDPARQKEINHLELATTFDKYLQFESDVQAKWDQLNPVLKIVQRFLGNDPKTPDLIQKARGSGRIASIAANLFQMTELNPNIKELQDYVKEHDAGVSERNQELHQADQLIQTLQNKPKAQLDALGRVLIDLTSGIFERKYNKELNNIKAGDPGGDLKQQSLTARNQVMATYGLPSTIPKDISRIERYFRGKIHKLEALELSQVMEKWESGRLNTEQLKKQGYISGTVQSSSFKEYEDLFYNKPSTEPQVMIYEQ